MSLPKRQSYRCQHTQIDQDQDYTRDCVIAELKPIYKDLSDDRLLSKCLHGLTQNCNESFNRTVYDRIPKSNFWTTDQFHFGIYIYMILLQISILGLKLVCCFMKNLAWLGGRFALQGCIIRNKKRVYHVKYKNQDSAKRRVKWFGDPINQKWTLLLIMKELYIKLEASENNFSPPNVYCNV